MPQVQQHKYDLLATTVTAILAEKGLSIGVLAVRLYSQMGYDNPASARFPLKSFSKGCIYGTTSSKPSNPYKGLERLAIFLYELGVPETDSVILGLREIDSGFQYPR